MEQLTQQKTVGAKSCTVLDLERVMVRHRFKEEQKKLEDMVTARFNNGHINLGADTCILKQSVLLDQLVVTEMELEEVYTRYHKDQHSD